MLKAVKKLSHNKIKHCNIRVDWTDVIPRIVGSVLRCAVARRELCHGACHVCRKPFLRAVVTD
jgi:hypothetical protein